VVTDGLLLVTAAYTWAWDLWFGPILLEATVPLVSKLTVGSFLLLDIVGLCCALMLVARSVEQGVVGVARLWALAMAVLVVTHVQVVDDVLHGGYVPGGLADLGLTTGVMLVGLTTPIMRRALAAWRAERPDTTVVDVRTRPESAAPIWRLVLPYALLPGVGMLVVSSAQAGGALHQGVLVGSVCLVGLVLLRQVCALLENRRLYQQVAAANARLAALAMTDPLTGLPHHGAMVATLDRELERARRIGQRCAVLFLDLDHFKRLNDQHGHLAGDAALAQVAASLRGEVRQMDALGRWGGEEFLVILPDTEAATARRIAERLRAAVGGLAVVADREVRLTCSIGLAIYPEDAMDRDTLLQAADSAMYTAKDRGRDQVCASADARVPRPPRAADQLAA
jgi:diguanylate cyclase (GGDEF)-like protein